MQVAGAVQGVGFRPFVYRLATSEGLAGWVCNTSAGVSLEVEGEAASVARFMTRLKAEARPPAAIENTESQDLRPTGETGFCCETSSSDVALPARVLPDLAMCEVCRAEISDPGDRRYRYPFTTCMHCGPRFSIIEAVPYDRERTVMRDFPMCPACAREYRDPASRRFHAEANACPDCGPQLSLLDGEGHVQATRADALVRAIAAIRQGKILALKGIGGFQLLADARSQEAVSQLRLRKHRPAKPFAVMVPTFEQAQAIVQISHSEAEALRSPAGPIVLLRARGDAATRLARGIAPASPLVGVMLPTTPLHHLLLRALGFPVVATSGNRSGEPIAATDGEAMEHLAGIADLFLTHDRPILHRVDDSVVRIIDGAPAVLRCARGFAPVVLKDDRQQSPVIAFGGHLKSSVAIGTCSKIVLGPHIGDLDSAETRSLFTSSTERFTRLHNVQPSRTACDLHPDYHTSAFAEATELPAHKVQHHLAHVLSAMVEHQLEGPVLGIAWDGSGDGGDGTIWGGEFLLVDDTHWRRLAHMWRFPLPGGESAIREPRRSAIGALSRCYGESLWQQVGSTPLTAFVPAEREILRTALARKLNTPLTSSVGRLFDAVASICDLRQHSSFEGEAAMAVEFAADRARRPADLPQPVATDGPQGREIDWRPMLSAICEATQDAAPKEELAAGFHAWLADAACLVAQEAGIGQVVLTGGCFQNALLSRLVAERLSEAGFHPFLHRKLPCNDGGLAVGQAAFAARHLTRETG